MLWRQHRWVRFPHIYNINNIINIMLKEMIKELATFIAWIAVTAICIFLVICLVGMATFLLIQILQ